MEELLLHGRAHTPTYTDHTRTHPTILTQTTRPRTHSQHPGHPLTHSHTHTHPYTAQRIYHRGCLASLPSAEEEAEWKCFYCTAARTPPQVTRSFGKVIEALAALDVFAYFLEPVDFDSVCVTPFNWHAFLSPLVETVLVSIALC